MGKRDNKHWWERISLIEYCVGAIPTIAASAIAAIIFFVDLIPEDFIMKLFMSAIVGLIVNDCVTMHKCKEMAESYNEKVDSIVEAIKASSSVLVDRKRHYELLNNAVEYARHDICLMTIDQELTSKNKDSFKQRPEYYQSVIDAVERKPELTVRRIYGLPIDEEDRKDRKDWIEADLKEMSDCPNFNVRVFDWAKYCDVPAPLSLQIVDNTFVGMVNLADGKEGIIGEGQDICITDCNTVEHLKKYYMQIWEKCMEIKTGNQIFWDVLESA